MVIALATIFGVLVGVALMLLISRYTPATATIEQFIQPSAQKCEKCGRPANPVRTHDGKWRCAQHKVS